MTARLLHRTFDGDGYGPPRAALRERRTATPVALPTGVELRVGLLPLMRTQLIPYDLADEVLLQIGRAHV